MQIYKNIVQYKITRTKKYQIYTYMFRFTTFVNLNTTFIREKLQQEVSLDMERVVKVQEVHNGKYSTTQPQKRAMKVEVAALVKG